MTNRSQKSGQRTAICHWSFAKSLSSAVVRKNVAPASSRQTVLLTQKELSRLTCRRDAGATILSHDQRLCGEIFLVAASLFLVLGVSLVKAEYESIHCVRSWAFRHPVYGIACRGASSRGPCQGVCHTAGQLPG